MNSELSYISQPMEMLDPNLPLKILLAGWSVSGFRPAKLLPRSVARRES